jgi:hypothetical protein
MTPTFRDQLASRTQKGPWIMAVLLLVILASASFKLVVAQPHSEASSQASDTNETLYLSLGERYHVNPDNVAYTSDNDRFFDIYFACSSVRGECPLRLLNAREINEARSYFNNPKRHGNHFEKYGKYCINRRHIAYTVSKGDSLDIFFTARIADAFVQCTFSGADAESFRKKSREF